MAYKNTIIALLTEKIINGKAVLLMDRLVLDEEKLEPQFLKAGTYFLQENQYIHIDTFTGEWVYTHNIHLNQRGETFPLGHYVKPIEVVSHTEHRKEADYESIQSAIENELRLERENYYGHL